MKKQIMWLIGGILLAIAVFLTVLIIVDGKEEQPVLAVNENAVYAEEFSLLLNDNKLKYERELRQQFNIPAEESPATYLGQKKYTQFLRECHMSTMVELRIIQELAYRYGVIEELFSYAFFLQELERENADREQKLAAGEPIYGLKNFDAITYYSYYMSNLRLRTIEAMLAESEITDSAVDAYYRNEEKAFLFQGETLDYTVYDVSKIQEFPAEQRMALEQQVKNELAAGTDGMVGGTLFAEQRHWSSEEIRDMIRMSEDAEGAMLGKEPGAVSDPFYSGEAWLILRYDGFTKAENLSAADRGVLKNEMIEKIYEDAVLRGVRDAQVIYYEKNAE